MTLPEDFWIALGDTVIGKDVLREGQQARQYPTYKAIVDFICTEAIPYVLDIGCNYAPLAHFLDEAGYFTYPRNGIYTGVDSNPYVAHDNWPTVRQGNLRKLWFRDEWAHCVVVKDVIEHLESYLLLGEAFRVSSDYVVVSAFIPWSDAPESIVRDRAGYYMNRYNRTDVYRFAQSQGFGVYLVRPVSERNGAANEVVVFRRVME